MSKSMTIAVTLASSVVAGCGSLGDRPFAAMEELALRSSNPRIQCHGDCGLVVQISSGCNYASLRTMELEGGVGQRTLTWKIDGPYTFSREDYKFGIVVRGDARTPDQDPSTRISDAQITNGNKELTVRFDKRNPPATRTDTITYYLNLLHESSTPRQKVWCEIHPWIVDR
jgi:hypothetical protein